MSAYLKKFDLGLCDLFVPIISGRSDLFPPYIFFGWYYFKFINNNLLS